MSAGQRGLDAVRTRKFEEGVKLLDQALNTSNSPAWYLARAKAHQMLKQFEPALRDSEAAYHAAIERSSGTSRKHMIEAQYRRACVLFNMQRYADADCCALWSMLLAEGRPADEADDVEKNVDENGNYRVTLQDITAEQAEADASSPQNKMSEALAMGSGQKEGGYKTDWNIASIYRRQIIGALQKVSADHPGRQVSVTKVPPKPTRQKSTIEPSANSMAGVLLQDSKESDANTSLTSAPVKKATRENGLVPDEKMKLRVDYYQSNQTISITFFVKDVNKEQLKVKFSRNKVLFAPIPREAAPYVEPGDRESSTTILLPHDIDPADSRYTVTPRKIELSLKKVVPEKWVSWGEEMVGDHFGDKEKSTASVPVTEIQPAMRAQEQGIASAYPTSSKTGPKNWDKVVANEDDGADSNGDANEFFKYLYKNSSADVQRAMMKSMVESNGTALSTDWNDVKSRTVETHPPTGVEARKWER